MARKHKREAVTASFHYMARYTGDNGSKPVVKPFSKDEFSRFVDRLLALPPIDLKSEQERDKLRFKAWVPIESVTRVNDRTAFGVFRGTYWGHAYDNTEKGKIPADSINLRPFHFLVYLSDKGEIYIGSQYLGLYGGYTGLERTLRALLPDSNGVVSHTFRLSSAAYRNVVANEVRVQVAKKPSSVTSKNRLVEAALITLKKDIKGDNFEKTIGQKLLPYFGSDRAKVRSAVADLLREDELIEVRDEEIVDCTVIGTLNGTKKTIYMIEDGSFATKFPLNVSVNGDGHPPYEQTKVEMLSLLGREIISRKVNA